MQNNSSYNSHIDVTVNTLLPNVCHKSNGPGYMPGLFNRKKVITLFDVNVITIDDNSISIKNVRQISLTSARLILVDDQGKQEILMPGIIDCMSMFNTQHLLNVTMEGDD